MIDWRVLPPVVTSVWLSCIVGVAVVLSLQKSWLEDARDKYLLVSSCVSVWQELRVVCLDPYAWLRWDFNKFYSSGEVSRVLSTCYFGRDLITFSMALRLYVVYAVSSQHERQTGSLNFACQWLLCAFCVLATATIMGEGQHDLEAALSPGFAISTALRCVWCLDCPDRLVSLYGSLSVKAKFVPAALMAINLFLGDDIRPEILGVAVGYVVQNHLRILFPFILGEAQQFNPGDDVLLKDLLSRPDLVGNRAVVQSLLPNGAAKGSDVAVSCPQSTRAR